MFYRINFLHIFIFQMKKVKKKMKDCWCLIYFSKRGKATIAIYYLWNIKVSGNTNIIWVFVADPNTVVGSPLSSSTKRIKSFFPFCFSLQTSVLDISSIWIIKIPAGSNFFEYFRGFKLCLWSSIYGTRVLVRHQNDSFSRDISLLSQVFWS